MKLLISALLIIHGLIVASQAAGSFGSMIPAELRNPSFVNWWPINMGRSWLFSWLGLEKTLAVYRIGGPALVGWRNCSGSGRAGHIWICYSR